MKLDKLVRKPQLVEVTIDSEEMIAEYGEPLTFHTWDRQPMDVFLKMATASGTDYASLVMMVRDLILDEHGKPMLTGELTLPPKVTLAVIAVVVEGLGK